MRFGNRGGMTVRVTYKDGSIMLFGNSYKDWRQQFVEFTYRHYGSKTMGWRYQDLEPGLIVKLERSASKWIGWGGLKWCDEASFQQELNREGCQDSEPDNPHPRQYSNFFFQPYNMGVATKALKEYY